MSRRWKEGFEEIDRMVLIEEEEEELREILFFPFFYWRNGIKKILSYVGRDVVGTMLVEFK